MTTWGMRIPHKKQLLNLLALTVLQSTALASHSNAKASLAGSTNIKIAVDIPLISMFFTVLQTTTRQRKTHPCRRAQLGSAHTRAGIHNSQSTHGTVTAPERAASHSLRITMQRRQSRHSHRYRCRCRSFPVLRAHSLCSTRHHFPRAIC